MFETVKRGFILTALASITFYFLWSAFFKTSTVSQTQYQATRSENYNVNNNENVNINLMFSTLAEGRGWCYTNEKFEGGEELIKFIQSRLSFFQQMYCKPVFTGGSMYVLYPVPTNGIKTNTYMKVTVITNSNFITKPANPFSFLKSLVSMKGNDNDGSRP